MKKNKDNDEDVQLEKLKKVALMLITEQVKELKPDIAYITEYLLRRIWKDLSEKERGLADTAVGVLAKTNQIPLVCFYITSTDLSLFTLK